MHKFRGRPLLQGVPSSKTVHWTVFDDEKSINLGSVYETVVASELIAHRHKLFYYDNKNKGEVDYLIDDYNSLSAVPIDKWVVLIFYFSPAYT